MSAPLKDRGKSHVANGECGSTTWSEEARSNTTIMKRAMTALVEEKVNVPIAVLALVNTILNIFLGLKSLKEHKNNFTRLVADASALVAIIRKLEVFEDLTESLSQYVARLDPTMNSVNKLLTTKAKRNVAKRKICILLDLAKLNKYQERLESVAADLERESRSVNVNMTQILLDVIDEHIKGRRPQDRRISNSEGGVVDDGHVKQKAVEKTHKEGNNLFGKHKKQQYDPEISEDEEIIDSEEDNSDKIALEQPKPKGAHDLQAAQYSFSNADNLETYERLGREKGKKPEIRYTAEPEAEAEDDSSVESIPPQVYRLPKEATRQGRDLARAVSEKSPLKSKGPLKPGTYRSRTTPTGSKSSISDFKFINGAGTMNNHGIGTIHEGHV